MLINGTNLAGRHMPALIEMVGRHTIGGENAVRVPALPSNRVAGGAALPIRASGPQVFVEPLQRTLPGFLGRRFVIARGRIVMETVISALIDVTFMRYARLA